MIKLWHEYWHACSLMQSTFVDVTSNLQLCFAKFLGHYIIVQVDYKLSNGFAASITRLLTFFF